MQAAEFAGDNERSSVTASGLWRLAADGVVPIDRSYVGPATVLVPNEDILVVVLDLPFATRRQREAAAPFAVEGLIGEPLDQVHVALGQEISDRKHLCGVVRRETMRRWIEALDQAGLGASLMVPDALAMPAPPEGAWRVAVEDERAVVRSGDGAGFAITLDALPMAWAAAGEPRLLSSDAALPEVMRAGIEDATFDLGVPARPVMVIPPLDLRQGEFATVRRGVASPMRTLAWVVGLGVAAHLAILTADTVALQMAAGRAEARVRAVLAERAPGADATDLTAAVDRIAPDGVGGEGPFVASLGRTSRALAGGRLAFRSISYTPDAPLQLAVSAPDAPTLDAGVEALNRSGLAAEARLDPTTDPIVPAGGLNAAIAVAGPEASR